MTEEQRPAEAAEPDEDEAKFWTRLEGALDARFSDEKFEAALDRWAAKISADIDDDEEPAADQPKGRRKAEERTEDAKTEELEGDAEPSVAERQRGSGGIGPRSRSGYWKRVSRFIY